MTLRSPRWLLAVPLALSASGCGLLHSVETKPAPPVPLPEGYSQASAERDPAVRWWTTFEDPRLEKVVAAALSDNLGLAQAFTRLDQAQAMLDGANAGYWPTITADAGVTGARNVFNFGNRAPMPDPNAEPSDGTIVVTNVQYNLSLGASYEVDLWGRVHSLANAAELDLAATQQDVQAAVMSVTAQAAELWFQLEEAVATERLLLDQVERNETQLELMELRFSQGLANAVDVFQQRQALAASKTQLPPVRGMRRTLENSLAILLGMAPGSPLPAELGAGLPALPALPAVGLPAGLVGQRPDVRAAQLRVVAADHRIGAALAARFPAIRLSASTGFRAFDLADLFKNWIWNLVAGLTAPIFDGGRLAANQRLAEAQMRDRVAGYGQVVLTAFSEVENAMALEASQQAYVVELEAQLEAARKTWEEAYSRYANGLSEYLPVLTALREVQALERAQIAAQRQLLSYRIQLHRALGGAWMSEVERPKVLAPEDGDKSS